MLNKFAVVPEHFILATKEWKSQTRVLEQDDLEATLACIEAYEIAEKGEGDSSHDGLFAYFNCGEHSGASQPHRHIQLLPVARIRDGLEADSPWAVLAENLVSRKAPFVTLAEPIQVGMSGKDLHDVYLRLYRQACRVVGLHKGDSRLTDDVPVDGEAEISYNLAMTRSSLVVCPRLAEGAQILGSGDDVLGTLSLNGTVLAGTALVKTEQEWDALRNDPRKLLTVLRGIGIPIDDVHLSKGG